MTWFSFFARKLNKITKFIEENREKFTQLDLEDVQVREKLKHASSKAKKLEKQLQKDKEKVGFRRIWISDLIFIIFHGCASPLFFKKMR